MINHRGGSGNSSRGGGFWAGILRGGGGVRVQVHGNFHILTSKKTPQKTSEGGLTPLTPPPPPRIINNYANMMSLNLYSSTGLHNIVPSRTNLTKLLLNRLYTKVRKSPYFQTVPHANLLERKYRKYKTEICAFPCCQP